MLQFLCGGMVRRNFQKGQKMHWRVWHLLSVEPWTGLSIPVPPPSKHITVHVCLVVHICIHNGFCSWSLWSVGSTNQICKGPRSLVDWGFPLIAGFLLVILYNLCGDGVMCSLEREEAEHLIKCHGGRVTTSVSKKTVCKSMTFLGLNSQSSVLSMGFKGAYICPYLSGWNILRHSQWFLMLWIFVMCFWF